MTGGHGSSLTAESAAAHGASPGPDTADARHLTRLAPGHSAEGVLRVVAVEPRAYGDGKECTVLTLGDAGGRIDTAPFWSARRSMVQGIASGMIVEVAGEVRIYRGRRQLEVSRIAPAGAAVDPLALLPSAGDPAPRWERIDRWRGAIRGPRLAAVLSLFYDDAVFRADYGQCPASSTGHHAELGGLLRHTCEVAAIGQVVAGCCGADPDLVLAGALLHDIGKLRAYRWSAGFETTDAGALLGHVALGLRMLDERVAAQPAPPCTETELLLLLHLIASHHGRPEFGATVPPMSLEAEVLHYADNASAKTASMADALRDPENFTGDALVSARGLWQLERRKAYRGSSDWGAKKERPPSRG